MKYKIYKNISLRSAIKCLLALVFIWANYANAGRQGKMDYAFTIPYFEGKELNFSGGAAAELNSDPGFGFSFAYNNTDKLAGRVDITFNSISYDGLRILDDGSQTKQRIGGSIDSSTIRMGGSYYFFESEFTPFIDANIGWNFFDSNVISGPPSNVCWWDPWWGYICDSYVPTHTESSFTYGLGLGVRAELFESNYIRLGYFVDFIDFDKVSGTEDFNAFVLEFGLSY